MSAATNKNSDEFDILIILGVIFVPILLVSYWVSTHQAKFIMLMYGWLKPVASINLVLDAIGLSAISSIVFDNSPIESVATWALHPSLHSVTTESVAKAYKILSQNIALLSAMMIGAFAYLCRLKQSKTLFKTTDINNSKQYRTFCDKNLLAVNEHASPLTKKEYAVSHGLIKPGGEFDSVRIHEVCLRALGDKMVKWSTVVDKDFQRAALMMLERIPAEHHRRALEKAKENAQFESLALITLFVLARNFGVVSSHDFSFLEKRHRALFYAICSIGRKVSFVEALPIVVAFRVKHDKTDFTSSDVARQYEKILKQGIESKFEPALICEDDLFDVGGR